MYEHLLCLGLFSAWSRSKSRSRRAELRRHRRIKVHSWFWSRSDWCHTRYQSLLSWLDMTELTETSWWTSWWIFWWHSWVFCSRSRLHAVLSQHPAFIAAILYALCGQTTSVGVSSKKTPWTELKMTLNWEVGVEDSGTFQVVPASVRRSTAWYLLMLLLSTGMRKDD